MFVKLILSGVVLLMSKILHHLRIHSTVSYQKMSSKGSRELIFGVSGAKCRAELDFEVQKCLSPQKPSKNAEKLIFRDQQKIEKLFWGVKR